MTSEQLTLGIFPNAIASAEAFHAKLFQLLETDEASKILEGLYSLRSCGWLKPDTLGFYSLKMSRGFSTMMEEEPLKPLSERWMNWGILQNGKCLTAEISESHKTGKGCSLSDILEDQVDEKYFLSPDSVKLLMK